MQLPSRSRGRSGATYDYFFCLGRHARRTECDLPALWVDAVEEAVARQYRSLQPNQHTVERLRRELVAAMRRQTAGAEKLARRQRKRVTTLEGERRRLLQAHLAGAAPLELLKEQQDRITRQLADAGAALAATEVNWENTETNLRIALKFVATFEDALPRGRADDPAADQPGGVRSDRPRHRWRHLHPPDRPVQPAARRRPHRPTGRGTRQPRRGRARSAV